MLYEVITIDFFEIAFIIVPLVVPAARALGIDVTWLGIVLAVNLQTSFLTPPFGFSLFYLRGVTPAEISTTVIYRGVVPFRITSYNVCYTKLLRAVDGEADGRRHFSILLHDLDGRRGTNRRLAKATE